MNETRICAMYKGGYSIWQIVDFFNCSALDPAINSSKASICFVLVSSNCWIMELLIDSYLYGLFATAALKARLKARRTLRFQLP